MKTRLMVSLMAGGLMAAMLPGVVAADSPNFGCKDTWLVGKAVSDDAVKRDRNGDGLLCFKYVNGKGNGDYLIDQVVVKDNNKPVK